MLSSCSGPIPSVRQNTNSPYSGGKLLSPMVFCSSSLTCSTFFFPVALVVHHGFDRLGEELVVFPSKIVDPALGHGNTVPRFLDAIDHREHGSFDRLFVVQKRNL